MPVDEGRGNGEPHVRAVLDILLQDIALQPLPAAALPWDRPVLVLRAAPMDQLERFIEEADRHGAAALHILSHARDREAIAAMAPRAIFHAYPTPGRYKLEEIPAALLHRLRSHGFAAFVFLEPGTSAELFDEAERIFAATGAADMVTFSPGAAFARPGDWGHRRRAQAAFLQLVEWYQSRVASAPIAASNQEAVR